MKKYEPIPEDFIESSFKNLDRETEYKEFIKEICLYFSQKGRD